MLYAESGEKKTSFSDQSLLEWEFSDLRLHPHWFEGSWTFSFLSEHCPEKLLPPIPPPHTHTVGKEVFLLLTCIFLPHLPSQPPLLPPLTHSGRAAVPALHPWRGTRCPTSSLMTHSTSSRCILWWTKPCPPSPTGPGSSKPWSGKCCSPRHLFSSGP